MLPNLAEWTPKLTPQDLETILNLLPSPNTAVVSVVEGSKGVDYAFLHQQIKKDNPFLGEVYLPKPRNVELVFHHPEKNLLSKIYQDHFRYLVGLDEGIRGRTNERIISDLEKTRLEVVNLCWEYISPLPPRWTQEWGKLGDNIFGSIIRLTPSKLYVGYPKGKEPQIVTVLRDNLCQSHLDIEIEPYKRD